MTIDVSGAVTPSGTTEGKVGAAPQPDRRAALFRLAGLGIVAPALAVAPRVATATPNDPSPDPAPASRGYRETDHVRAYYRTMTP